MLRINSSLRAGFLLLNKRNSSYAFNRQIFLPSVGGLSYRFRHMSGLTTYPLESLGDSITTAVLVTWQKNIGDSIKEDDVLAVVETDKVTMDIRSKNNGVLKERLVEPGAEIAVGAPLYKLDVGAESGAVVTTSPTTAPAPVIDASAAPSTTETSAAASISPASHEVLVPIMGESITSGMLAKWSVKVGDAVKLDDVVAAIETDKVTVEVHSPYSGIISEIFSAEGAEVNVGQKLFTISSDPNLSTAKTTPTPSPSAAAALPTKETVSPSTAKPAAPSPPPAAPVAASSNDKKSKPSTPTTASTNLSGISSNQRSETRVKMTRMRQRIAQRLKEAQNTAAMLTTFQELDMTALMALRGKYKDDFEKAYGIKLGFMGAFVRASTAALLELPAVNAVIDDTTNEIVYHNYVDISVAVASPNGLVVPVLRDTQNMTISDIEKAISIYGKKAKDGALALEDMTGGTFTISNGGVFGSLFGTPIINPPQSAILGMHATKMRAVVIDGKVEARPMMYLALTYDHRLVDGREAVTFLKSVASKIEDPSRLVLGL